LLVFCALLVRVEHPGHLVCRNRLVASWSAEQSIQRTINLSNNRTRRAPHGGAEKAESNAVKLFGRNSSHGTVCSRSSPTKLSFATPSGPYFEPFSQALDEFMVASLRLKSRDRLFSMT
jgi:hypothetical protein